ncbi:MAG: hypothetical protein RLZZ184_1555 [Cyanobacteriota bacterium]|jgi:hypothetical protein
MKAVEVTLKVLIDVDDNIVDVSDLDSRLVVCFYHEDTYGTEHFLPKADGLSVTEYLGTTIDSITEIE